MTRSPQRGRASARSGVAARCPGRVETEPVHNRGRPQPMSVCPREAGRAVRVEGKSRAECRLVEGRPACERVCRAVHCLARLLAIREQAALWLTGRNDCD